MPVKRDDGGDSAAAVAAAGGGSGDGEERGGGQSEPADRQAAAAAACVGRGARDKQRDGEGREGVRKEGGATMAGRLTCLGAPRDGRRSHC